MQIQHVISRKTGSPIYSAMEESADGIITPSYATLDMLNDESEFVGVLAASGQYVIIPKDDIAGIVVTDVTPAGVEPAIAVCAICKTVTEAYGCFPDPLHPGYWICNQAQPEHIITDAELNGMCP